MVNFGHLLNFLKTVQKQSLTAFKSFSKTLNVISGLFKPFLTSWKNGQKRPKGKGLPLTILVNFGHYFNVLKMVQKQRQTAFESFSTTPNVILGLFKPFLRSWKYGQRRPKSKRLPLTILVNFGHLLNFLKTVQKQSLTAFKSFSKTLNVISGLFKPFLRSWKNGQKLPKSKGLPLTILVNFGHHLNFLKTVQKQSLTAFKSFSKTLNVISGLFKPFSRSWKNGQKRPKSKGLPLTILVNFGHFFNFLKMVQKQRQTAFESFSTTPNVILGLFKPFLRSWKNGQRWPKSKG